MDSLPTVYKGLYARDFAAADAGYHNGRVAATAKSRAVYWRNWRFYCIPLGVDPFLQGTQYDQRARYLSGFAARVRSGGFGRGREVKADTVATALSAVGKEISLVHGVNPIKTPGSERLIPRLAQMLDGWRKSDPPVEKKLPVEVDVPDYLVKLGLAPEATPLVKAVGDLVMVAFYYLLRVGEYTCKGTRNESKQTVQFHGRNVTFFKRNKRGQLVQMSREASDEEIMEADSATLRLENQKNGWQGVCINHEHNDDEIFSPVRALGRRILHIRSHGGEGWQDLPISTVFTKGEPKGVTDKNIRTALKLAAAALDYPARGMPIDRIDTHSLRGGGANALSLAGYSDTQIQKMGRWRGETFKTYIREQLSNFSVGMSKSMKKMFGFVNVEGGTGIGYDITASVIGMEYNVGVSNGASAE